MFTDSLMGSYPAAGENGTILEPKTVKHSDVIKNKKN